MEYNSVFEDLDVSDLIGKLSEKELFELLEYVEIVTDYERYNTFHNMYPDSGEFNRTLYPKHVALLNASANYREICMLGGNRSGKSVLGAYITACHATGIYPDWYTGKRFRKPTKIWVGGDTATTCRDIIQLKLLGRVGDFGSGMLPRDSIKETRPRRNVPDAIEIIRVNHVSGGISEITLKTYEQGRETWQGTEVDFIWIDEECPADVYTEALMRTTTTKGYLFLTFTPLSGLTDVVLNFMNNDQNSDAIAKKFLQYVTWDDCGHLSQETKDELFNALPPHEREARSKGIPTVGAGKIYPVPEDDYTIAPLSLPKYFPRSFGMDVGWNCTAALWGALDREADVLYIYDEYTKGEAEPAVHASAIRARGEWIQGVIDPAARGRSQHDGTKLFEKYIKEGLKITPADNGVESGIYEVWNRLNTGRLKIFNTCTSLLRELRLYRRDDKGKIVKKDDHLCLSADTLVPTKGGIKELKNITSEDYIFNGQQYVKTTGAALVKENTEFVELLLSNNTKIKATPDHCFLGINELWYPSCISKGITVLDMEEVWKLKSLITNNKNLMEKYTGNAENIINDMEQGYIELFGNIITDLFQNSTISIIKTLTGKTTKSKIWNVFLKENTCTYTCVEMLKMEFMKVLQKQCEKRQQSGTAHPQVKSGIENIMKTLKKYYTEGLKDPVHSVEKFIAQLDYIVTHLFALIIANLHTDELQKKTMKNGFVLFAEKNMNVTNILRKKLVHDPVLQQQLKGLEVLTVNKIENQDAWCLYEKDRHSFMLNNGVISNNCDCLRYLTVSGVNRATVYVDSLRNMRDNKVIPIKAAAWT